MSLKCDDNDPLHGRPTLTSGRSVSVHSLHQSRTYAGWLEGVPTSCWNDGIVEGAIRDAETYGVAGSRPLLIAPVRQNFLREPGDMEKVRTLHGRAAEWLPMVSCAAVFGDVFPARDKSKDASCLTVVWFQEQFAMPIDVSVLDKIRAIDWEALATDYEF